MKLGLVTYNLARAWDVDAIIKNCRSTGFEGVELRTTHAHGVEPTLGPERRAEVKQKFADNGVEIAGLGTIHDFHSPNPQFVRENIEGTKAFVKLAHDIGCPGVKVRPNGLPADVPVEKTLDQIGLAFRECAEFADDYGVQIRVEVHGQGTSDLRLIRRMLDIANHRNVTVCWNSNSTDIEDGSIRDTFALVSRKIGLVHITELYNPSYPYRDLFRLLRAAGYQGFCLAEIAESSEPERLMRYYRSLFDAFQQI